MKKTALFTGFIFALLLALPRPANAAEFTATVDNNQVAEGESVTLQLLLSGADAKDAPDTTALKKSFAVVSQGETSNTMIVNGSVTSTVGWQLTLIPKESGTVTVPPVTIETSAGALSTQPITLEVGAGGVPPLTGQSAAPPVTGQSGANPFGSFPNPFAAPPPAQSPTPGQTQGEARGDRIVSITASVSQTGPYQNQPLLYTAKVVARANLADASFQDFAVENAIVERQGEPDVRDAVENGKPVKIMELHYLITPLKAGKIVIPPTVLQGTAMTAERDPFSDGFQESFKALQSLDPNQIFGNMGSFSGFNTYKPFRSKSASIELDVKPPAAVMDPWLPLTSLDIKEERNTAQSAKVGEPVTRKLTLLAEGAVGTQLPKLDALQNRADFKVYADKPQTGESVDKKTGYISGWRQEGYSLIPRHAGRLVLPEIKIPWWDIANNKVSYAVLPEEVIDVQGNGAEGEATPEPAPPAQATSTSAQTSAAGASAPSSVAAQAAPHAAIPGYLYAVIAGLAALLLAAVSWVMHLRREMRRLSVKKSAQPAPAPPAASLSGLEPVKTAEELNTFLKSYAARAWGSPPNASLEAVFAAFPAARRGDAVAAADIAAVTGGISGALYAGKPADIEDLKTRARRILTASQGTKNDNAARTEKLPKLNPS